MLATIPILLLYSVCLGRCQPKQACKAKQATPGSDSAIGTHLLNSVWYGNSDNKDCFRI